MARYRLTTVDNDHDPFTDFKKWYETDMDLGYNTCAKIASIALTSDAFTEQENEQAIEDAIDEIIKYDFQNLYKKVKEKPKSTPTEN